MNVESLMDEQLVRVLTYLRATEIAAATLASKRFDGHVVNEVVREQMCTMYAPHVARDAEPVIDDGQHASAVRSLYFTEIRFLLSVASTPEPQHGNFISKHWLADAKKHWESQLTDRTKLSKKQARIRYRRSGDASMPRSEINADITCIHGNLAATKHVRRKRRVIDQRSWNILSQYFSSGAMFKSTCHDCEQCQAAAEQQHIEEVQRDIHVKEERRRELTASHELMSIYSRRHGIPFHCQQAVVGDPPFGPCPLIPGLYYVVPRSWMTAWRKYMKDSRTVDPGVVDCTGLLCPGHGLLCPPPHVEEYIVGLRQQLFNHLGAEDRVPCELLSAEEWDALVAVGRASDFSVRFVLDPDGAVQWSLQTCTRCDRGHDAVVAVRPRQRNTKSAKAAHRGI